MKILATLAIAQLVLLAVVAAKLFSLERVVDAGATGAVPASAAVAAAAPREVGSPRPEVDWEARLRRIVREELVALQHSGTLAGAPASQPPGPASIPPSPDPARLAAVNSQLDYFISVGRISPVEMSRLQSQIARLDEAGRREMLGKLTEALNTGGLDGQL